MQDAPRADAFTALDWIGVVVSGVAMLGVLFFPAGSFEALFAEMGDPATLPLLTRLVVTTWFRFAIAVPVVVALGASLRSGPSLGWKRAWLVFAFVLAIGGLAVSLVGVYLPIFSLAGSIRAD